MAEKELTVRDLLTVLAKANPEARVVMYDENMDGNPDFGGLIGTPLVVITECITDQFVPLYWHRDYTR